MYFFKEGAPVQVERIANFMHPDGLTTQQLPHLGNQERLWSFALACINKTTIILTGGSGKDYKGKNDCFGFNAADGIWCETELPGLQVARYQHSSCSIGSYVYVICGYSTGFLNSIE